MALGDKYATLAELKARVAAGLTLPVDADRDARLNNALDTASRAIEKACGRQFNLASSATARLYEPCSDYLLEVDDFASTSGLIVKLDSAGDGTFATTVASTNYEARPLNNVVDGESGWPYWKLCAINYCWPTYWQRAPMQVTATWGWSAVPSGVHEACLILAEETFKLADTPFGTGGYGQFGIINARKNPNAWLRIAPYAKIDAIVPVA